MEGGKNNREHTMVYSLSFELAVQVANEKVVCGSARDPLPPGTPPFFEPPPAAAFELSPCKSNSKALEYTMVCSGVGSRACNLVTMPPLGGSIITANFLLGFLKGLHAGYASLNHSSTRTVVTMPFVVGKLLPPW